MHICFITGLIDLKLIYILIALLLRTREDTVRQIVGSLTGDAEGCSDLANELSRADPVTLETQDSEDEGSDPEDWTPDPTDALTGLCQLLKHSSTYT